MALHNLKIIIVDGGRTENYTAKTTETTKPLLNVSAKKTLKEKMQSGMTPASVFAMDMGLRVAGQIVKQGANYFLSDIGRRTGDSNYQNMINKQLSLVSDTLSVGGSILSGATAGSMFGPVGAGIGAVLGAVSSAVTIGFQIADTKRNYQHEMFKNETSQQYALTRANYSIYTGRRV